MLLDSLTSWMALSQTGDQDGFLTTSGAPRITLSDHWAQIDRTGEN
jgi:hypothetical protein